MKRESCVAAGILFKVWIHPILLYILQKKPHKTILLLHFTFSYFVKGNAVAQVTWRLSSSRDQVKPLLELSYPRCAFNLKMTL